MAGPQCEYWDLETWSEVVRNAQVCFLETWSMVV